MKWLLVLWGVFGVLFLSLTIFHLFQSTKKIKKFEVTERPGSDSGSVAILGADVDQPIRNFAQDFNEYLSDLNKSNKVMNFMAAGGYFLAALTAFFSMYLSIISK